MSGAGVKIRDTAVIVAGGKGLRMGGGVKKQYRLLLGQPLLCHTIRAFENSPVEEIIVVCGREDIAYVQTDIVDAYSFSKVSKVVAGGETRAESVCRGIREASGDFVLIHDGARPAVPQGVILRCLEAVHTHSACVAAVPSVDTVKVADADGFVDYTPPRERVWSIQTPQCFSRTLILDAYERMFAEKKEEGVTDDAMVLERMTDRRILLVEGSEQSLKVTAPGDIERAETYLRGAAGD